MDYQVLVKPNSSKDEIFRDEEYLIVRVTDPPKEGKANKKVIKLVADFLDVSKSEVFIKSGLTSRKKIISV